MPPGCREVVGPLLVATGRAGIELAPHPGQVDRLRHCPVLIPPHLSARLRLHRAAVLDLLVNGYVVASGSEAEYILGERLGIAEGMRMPIHAGSAAWLVAVGESMGASP